MKTAKTKDIAQKMGTSVQYALRLMTDLHSRGLVRRIGQRGGWVVTEAGEQVINPNIPITEDQRRAERPGGDPAVG